MIIRIIAIIVCSPLIIAVVLTLFAFWLLVNFISLVPYAITGKLEGIGLREWYKFFYRGMF